MSNASNPNLLIAAKWMWSHKGLYWRPTVLTDSNNDPASPKLNIAEAVSIFKNLEERGLIFRVIEKDGVAFLLHESKVQEWELFFESFKQSGHNLDSESRVTTDHPTCGKENEQAKKQIASSDVNEIGHIKYSFAFWGYFDNFSKLLAGIAFVFWMIDELVLPHNKIFLVLAVLLGLADVFYLLFHKMLMGNRLWIILGWIIYLVFSLVLVFHKDPESTKLSKPHLTIFLQIGPNPKSTIAIDQNLFLPEGSPFNAKTGKFLVLPTGLDRSNTLFTFMVSNDSPRLVEHISLRVWIPKLWRCRFNPDWEIGDNPNNASYHSLGEKMESEGTSN